MRTSKTLLILALALVLPATVRAQQPTPPANEPTPPIVTKFTADFGARGTTTTGDASRYERFRDMSDGVFLETARFHREQNGWIVDANGNHVGRQDQKLWGTFVKPGKFKGSATWDEIPLLMSRTTQTIYTNEIGWRAVDSQQHAVVPADDDARAPGIRPVSPRSPIRTP